MPNKAKLTTRERSSSNVSSDNLNKGSELSFAEVDSNFINLRDQSIAISDGSTTTDIDAGETITFSGASVSGGSSSSGGNLGDLQVNGTTLSPVTTNADLNITANGTGKVDILNSKFSTAQGTISSIDTDMNTIDGGSSTGPSRLLLKATGGTDAVAGRDKNTIHFESHSGHFMFQKTGGTEANLTTEIGSGMTLKLSALEGTNSGAGGIIIDGRSNEAITFHQKIAMNQNPINDASTITAGTISTTGDAGVKLEENTIQTTASNADLELKPSGTGGVVMEVTKVIITNLPTSDPSVAGQLYNSSGTLKISAG